MSLLIDAETPCPRCGSAIALALEPGEGTRVFVEDCPVCCEPAELTARFREGVLVELSGRAENA